ncbi:MAG: hypothetical protein JW825_06860, partial [Candidatus Methanofastidiosa archaeon]|nr:hypothetical protein [Candidatus Methanofastidiosa archaeon]
MIYPARMRKLELLVLKEQKDDLIQDLYDLQCVELIESEVTGKYEVPAATRECLSKSIQIDRMLNFLGHYAPEEKLTFVETLRGKQIEKINVCLECAEGLVQRADAVILELDPKLKDLEHSIAEIEESSDFIKDQIELL